ncbi:hypothetical protein [Streptomyces sp. NPDC021356]|uniref:hypothetical protein n=1 Tax=Streptomyces sp. NPDC021356 TaxID=3154900 RepID=UPI0033D0DAF7
MADFARLSTYSGIAAIIVPLILIGQAGEARADELPFPGGGYSSVGGPARPGEVVDLTVKERPGNPHPTAVEVASPALEDDTALGDTKRAWVGAGRIKKSVKPGTYPVTFTLRHKDAECVAEADRDRDLVCDYPTLVLRSTVKVSVQDAAPVSSEGPGFGGGFAVGIASGAVAALAVGGTLLRLRRRQPADEPSES